MTDAADLDVLIVNAGSSSLKLAVLNGADEVTAERELERWDGSADHGELAEFLTGQGNGVGAVGHRVVHGGRSYAGPVLIDAAVLAGIEALTDLAPLHQPRALAGIEAVSRAAARHSWGGLFRYRVSRWAAGGGCHLCVAC